jgi:hypothetical protein
MDVLRASIRPEFQIEGGIIENCDEYRCFKADYFIFNTIRFDGL